MIEECGVICKEYQLSVHGDEMDVITKKYEQEWAKAATLGSTIQNVKFL